MPPLCGRKLIKVQMTPIIFPPPRHHSIRRNIDPAGRGQIIKLHFFLRREIRLLKSKQRKVVMSDVSVQTSCLGFKTHRVNTPGIAEDSI